MNHPTPDEFVAYVTNALAGFECSAFEAHVMVCGECEARLQAEARLELDLRRLAMSPAPGRVPRRALRWVAAAALAAGIGWCVVGQRVVVPAPPEREALGGAPPSDLPRFEENVKVADREVQTVFQEF